MRAPLHPAASAVLFFYPVILVLSHKDSETGYHPEDAYQDEPIDLVDINATCPTDRLLRTRETCHVDGADIACIRLHCCETHVHIAGRCVPKSVDPCSLQLCEQACDVRGDRLWCTCHQGFRFHEENYRRKTQPYCVDVNECAHQRGGCEQRCVNDPGSFHCECMPPYTLANNGRNCEKPLLPTPEPLPLVRASSRCYAPCDTVSWLSRKVKLLSDQLHTTQTVLKKIMENPVLSTDGSQFAEGSYTHRVLDATAPLEGGYCRCERGPRGPPGAPGMEGPKGDLGLRGPRGARGPKGSLDLMLLLLADVRHDIRNLEARVYTQGEQPDRFNLQKAWKQQRKQEKLIRESETEQDLEAYTVPPVMRTEGSDGLVNITPNGNKGASGEITHDTDFTTDWTLIKGEETTLPVIPSHVDTPLTLGLSDMDEKLRQFHILANTTSPGDEEEHIDDGDYDYSFY